MSGFYHQDERDEAAGSGCLALAAIVTIGVILAVALACMGAASADPMDGSTAGANAVTEEELLCSLRKTGGSGGVAYVKRDGEPPYMDRALYEVPEGVESYIVLDRRNNVEYLLVRSDGSIAITPRLGTDGNVIVMPQE